MGTSAEDALSALARDLLEEISAGRAVELVQAWQEDPEADLVELARFNVRPFQRTTTVHGRRVVENVGAHTAERGGAGAPASEGMQSPKTAAKELHSADVTGPGLEHPGGWIPDPDWVKGQAEWAAKGEAIWKANQWKAHAKLHQGIGQTAEHVTHGPPAPKKKGGGFTPNHFEGTDTGHHLHEAQVHLQAARQPEEGSPGEHVGQAYHHLLEAHREGTEKALPRAATPEGRKHVEEGLKQIRGHLDTLDQSMGMRKGSSSKPLEAEHAEGLKASNKHEKLSQLGGAVAQTSRQLDLDPSPTRVSLWRFDPQNDAQAHLRRAMQILSDPGGSVADAYHQLAEAHRIGVEFALPHAANPEQKDAIRKGLDNIQAHMEELDRIAGLDPKRTQQLLGSPQEHDERARVSMERQEDEKNSAPNWMAPGRRVTDTRMEGGAQTGTVTRVKHEDTGPYVEVKWEGTGRTGSYRLGAAKELLTPAEGEPPAPEGSFAPEAAPVKTDMEGDFAKEKAKSLVGKRVTIDPEGADPGAHAEQFARGKPGTVTEVPKEIYNFVTDKWEPNPGHYVNVQWDSAPGSDPIAVPADALAEDVPEPPKGAAAVHPGMGHHLARLPGDTISQRAYSHVPRPVDVAPPEAPSSEARALEQAGQRIQQYAQRDAARRDRELQQHLADQRAAEMRARGIAPPGEYAPLSDQEFAHHVQQLEETIAEALSQGRATDQQYALDDAGTIWDPDRSVLHRELISDYLNKQVNVPSQHQAIMMGGQPGAGKTTMLRSHPEINPRDYAVVNTDHFKEELAKRGMVPEVPGLSPLEASALVHEESAYLADLAAAELQRRGKNVIFDGTMRHEGTTRDRVKDLKKHGYNVGALFLDVPVRRSLAGVESRYRRELEAYRSGRNPLGGRHVPRSVVMSGEAAPGRTQARDTFEKLKSEFTFWERHDASGGSPRLVEKSMAGQQSGGIPSAEELRRQLASGPYTGATEEQARGREKGTAP